MKRREKGRGRSCASGGEQVGGGSGGDDDPRVLKGGSGLLSIKLADRESSLSRPSCHQKGWWTVDADARAPSCYADSAARFAPRTDGLSLALSPLISLSMKRTKRLELSLTLCFKIDIFNYFMLFSFEGLRLVKCLLRLT